MLVPDFPFPYDEYLAHPDGLGSIPAEQHGTEVAVVGAGMSGLVAAYELMKLGLKPVVYESAQLGGRLRGARQPGADHPVADLGGMRFPRSARAFFHYVDLLGLDTQPFPNPLTAASDSTVIEIAGRRHYAESPADLPQMFHDVGAAWRDCLEERAHFGAMQRAVADRDYATIKKLWNELVPLFDDVSFSHYLATSKAFSSLPFEYREAFGLVGFGTGGWDTNFPDSMLEILRVVYVDAEDDQQRILGGAQLLPQRLWQHAPEGLAHWPAGTSLASLHGGAPRGAVKRIRRAGRSGGPGGPGDGIEITDRWGRTSVYPAVVATCQSWLLSARIDTDESLFSHSLWTAIERTHYMQSSKTFVVVDRPFWKDVDPETGQHVLSTTLTDRLTRGTYLLDNGPDEPALICLSYTWNDDALKWLPLDVEERVRLMLHSLRQIYPNVDIASHIIGDPVTISWEDDPNFMGAFSDNLPGHYRYQERLYTHFMQDGFDPAHRGIYLAGDDVSWTGGWAEGAVTTGLNAVWGVLTQLGGKTTAGNPGPGDRFEELRPIRLP
ncbi:FAD-dependent oxidoreductase [Streptomyces sp. NBC_01275]|uniref:flavin monoamine oxidase family protein n=1 Tax=Streptomyces sp. NBC_01275 TaxID=2903807 RepID=UPI002251DCFF|nr:NAD(P)/FAD-dependent oxidoreductase [Streptomyces sp. NBC_01275]MCX4767689.1 FAD-dependent oxidoreductase [Streptomyces sp. NBC_01275]